MSEDQKDPYASPRNPGQPFAGNAAEVVGDKEQRTWALAAHLASFALYVFPFAGNLLGPLIVWLIKKDEMPFVDDQAKESINFQITVTIVYLIAVALACTPLGWVLIPAVAVYSVVMAVIAAIKANEGIHYRYPLTLRLLN